MSAGEQVPHRVWPVVLVVEDEALLRLDTMEMVENAGFAAISADNAAQAIVILENRTDVRIVISDIDMPQGINGLKLAALIRNRWPPIELILVSGHTHPEAHELPERTLFFAKPYRPEEIVAAMNDFCSTNMWH